MMMSLNEIPGIEIDGKAHARIDRGLKLGKTCANDLNPTLDQTLLEQLDRTSK